MDDELTPERTILQILPAQAESPRQTAPESEAVTPDHPDVLTWEQSRKLLAGFSPTERAKYVAESKELWEKIGEAPWRMTRTFAGARVRYDPKG